MSKLKRGEIVSAAPASLEVQGLTDDNLKSAIREAIGLTETAVRRLAMLWAEALRRELDLSDIRFALAPFLPLVAKGQLLPALVVTLAGQTRTLQRLADLPLHEQQRLAAGEPVPVYNPERGVQEKTLRQMSFPEVASVIRSGRILSVDEQQAAIVKRPIRQPRKSKIVELRIDRETYTAAAEAAAEEGITLDRYLRSIIIRYVTPTDEGRS